MQADTPHILVVDDDDRLSGLLKRFLVEAGFLVVTACDAADARRHLQAFEFDLIVLDRMMPGQNGLEFAADLRREGGMPILMLTAMGDAEDRIAGLEQGVDDYLAKPFEPRELLLRINAILRRAAKAPPPAEVRMGEVTFHPAREELLRAGRPVRLTDVEAALLKVLMERPGDIFSREELIERTGASGGGRAVDVQVTRLRRKIEPDPRLPRYLQTVRGRGYVLRPDE